MATLSRRLIVWLVACGSAAFLVLAPSDVRTAIISFLWTDPVARVLLEIALIAVVALGLVRWSVMGQLRRTVGWLQAHRLGTAGSIPLDVGRFFRPLFQEVVHLISSLETARARAEEEARLRNAAAFRWTAERLRAHVRNRIDGHPLIVVSNREPYMHVHRPKGIEVLVPASGLVTALEPVLRACDGTWVADGSGDADREVVDDHDRLRVPPDHPEYTLRRVWLTAEEEEGYYYGFANEGLWPLCHIAHTRPLFRESDWAAYRTANRRFAEAVIEEVAGAPGPVILVQDYHFALLPRMIKNVRPDARVGLFWHIPWPNPEAFGIIPWQGDVLDGMLGADLIGFHTQAHCNNFLETVDRAFESKIDREQFNVRRHGHVTHVHPFPISVAPPASPSDAQLRSQAELRTALLQTHGVSADWMGVGVDRVDYTKGIVERLRGIERFFEKWDRYVGRFTFVQIGAPSRTRIKRYQDLLDEVTAEAERINTRFARSGWRPIVLLTRHHDHKEIAPYYRGADLCLVTALHDGMNLVAKEFVTSRDDDDGVLVLSQFAGASRELPDALIVNPYDIEQLADTIRVALEMDPAEERARMTRMRRIVLENNVYRWAANLIGELAEIRPETTVAPLRFEERTAARAMMTDESRRRERATG